MTKLYLIIIYTVLFTSTPLFAQRINSIGQSNYGTAQSLFINPSLSGYSAYNWHINLAGVWANINNDFVTLKLPYSAYKIPNNIPLRYREPSGAPIFENYWLRESINGRGNKIDGAADIYGPSASIKIKNMRVGLFTQGAAGVRVHCLPENLSHAIINEFDSAKNAFSLFNPFSSGKVNQFEKTTIAANSRAQLGFNMAYNIPLEWDRQLIIGASIKRNWGFNAGFFQSEMMTLRPITADSIIFEPTRLLLMNTENVIGKSWGYDLGVTYIYHKKEFRKPGGYKENNTRYFYKISAAIMDIGSIKYKDASFTELNITRAVGINTTNLENYANNTNDYLGLLDSFINTVGSFSTYRRDVNIGLPTRFVISLEKQIRAHFFVNATLTQSLRKRHSMHARYQSTLMLNPRWEYAYFEVSVPLLLAYDYRAFRAGLSIRIGPIYLGTNSLASFLYTKGLRDVDIFAGIAFGNIPNFNLTSWMNNYHERKKKKRAQDCFKY